MAENTNERKITNKDIFQAYNKWYWLCEVSHCYDRLQSLSFCASQQNALRKLYPNDDDYQEALQRHLQFFNTEGTIGSVIHGITLSLEEEKSMNPDDISGEMIIALKTGLMGPIAGIGDTLIWGTLKPICLALATTMALSNNLIGAFFVLLFPLAGYFIGLYMCKLGYSLGRNAIGKLIQSGLMNRIIDACSILGLMMMGALSASYVSLTTTAGFKLENSDPILLQNILDGIMPGLLLFALIAGIYFYMKKKGTKYGGILLGIIIASIVLAFFDIV
ncbi:MAG: PTS system mannose/fructose/sorbose family transporter subunit IID [Longicatena caecimuris]|uniref:PTS system mannose/fructose/sorbose family transporter subunit IID n=1 Tax=Longicatena caecimuris TaxID=1796635 RepID=UPI00399BD2AF